MVWPGSSSSWWTIPFQSHQTLSVTFLGVNTGFATVCEASPGFDHDLFRTLLSYVIHFSSPVIIRFKTSSISFRFSSDSRMETRSIKLFTVNSCGTQASSFFWFPVLCIWLATKSFHFFPFKNAEKKKQNDFVANSINGSKLFYGRRLIP